MSLHSKCVLHATPVSRVNEYGKLTTSYDLRLSLSSVRLTKAQLHQRWLDRRFINRQ
jgi:hypothetical protein